MTTLNNCLPLETIQLWIVYTTVHVKLKLESLIYHRQSPLTKTDHHDQAKYCMKEIQLIKICLRLHAVMFCK